jgi:hypothetical protein
MTARASRLRRVASALMAHAADVLPPARSPWADAMRHELHHIESDLEALTWAAGCVLASYVERSRVMDIVQTWYVRGPLALLIVGQVLSMLFATVLTVAYRGNHLRVAAFLGGFTPGDDYRRFIPLMDATPWWIHGLWVAASALFFVSGWQLLRNRAAAFPLFAAAWVVGAIGNMISQSMPVYREVFSFPAPLFTRDYVVPAVSALVPVLIAVALWAHGRCSLEDRTSQGQA